MRLTVEEAIAIVNETLAYAKKEGIDISVAVVDEGARLKAFARMEEATLSSGWGAQGKAMASASFRRHGQEMEERKDMAVYTGVVRLEGGNMLPGIGAVPIYRDGRLIGACAIGGGNAEQDEECPTVAVEKVIGKQPPPRG